MIITQTVKRAAPYAGLFLAGVLTHKYGSKLKLFKVTGKSAGTNNAKSGNTGNKKNAGLAN